MSEAIAVALHTTNTAPAAEMRALLLASLPGGSRVHFRNAENWRGEVEPGYHACAPGFPDIESAYGEHVVDTEGIDGFQELATEPEADQMADLIPAEWLTAFNEAGFTTPEAVANATVEQLDALPCKGLGAARAQKLIAKAKTLVAAD